VTLSSRLFAVAVLAVMLMSSSAQNCFAVTELYYDDGSAESYYVSFVAGTRYAVRFSLPDGWSAADLVGVRFYIFDGGSATVRIYGSLTTGCDGVELQNFLMNFRPNSWNEQAGLTGISMTGDFCIAAEMLFAWYPRFGADHIDPPRVDPQRSWLYSTSTGEWQLFPFMSPATLMIRALVEESSPSYSVEFQQTGIPSGVEWGVTVGGTRYTSSTSSSTVSGLSGSVGYSYDSSVSGSGGTYVCTSGCSGNVAGAATVAATYTYEPPELTVSLVKPSDGASVACPIIFSAVVSDGSGVVSGATVRFYFEGGLVATKTTNLYGKAQYIQWGSSCPIPGRHGWYVTAEKSGYEPATSKTWSFIVPSPKLRVVLRQPTDGALVGSSVVLVAKVTFAGGYYKGLPASGAAVRFYVDGVCVGTAYSDAGVARLGVRVALGVHSWYATAQLAAYDLGTSQTWEFNVAER